MELNGIFGRKKDKFTSLLLEQTSRVVDVTDRLHGFLASLDPAVGQQIDGLEKDADEVRRILVEELMKSFVTPIDREDIFSLSHALDDIVDYAHTTVEEVGIFEVDPLPPMVEMAKLLHEAGVGLHNAILRIQDRHYDVATGHVRHVKEVENRIERIYRDALADLFRPSKEIKELKDLNKQVFRALKHRELYRHLSNAADRMDEAANVIAYILLKQS